MSNPEKDGGGPAFPSIHYNQAINGMKLRDWFAGMALSGIMANPETARSIVRRSGVDARKELSGIAFKLADEMIIRKEQP